MKELIRVNSHFEAQDLLLFLASEGIEAEIPDSHMLAIAGFANLGQGSGRVRVSEEDYPRALELLKSWNTHFSSKDPSAAQRVLEHPFTAGVSPRQVTNGVANWENLRTLGRVKVIGGFVLLPFVLLTVGGIALAFYQFITEQVLR